jgi:hypothetical protein
MVTLVEGNGYELPSSVDPKNNICVVKTTADGTKHWFYGSNIVTNDGDIYYAKKGAGETPASNEVFSSAACVLQNPASADTPAKADTYVSVTTPITTSGAVQAKETNYPKTNDGDSDNTGAGTDVVTYKFTWTTAQIDTSSGNAITGGAIYDSGQTSPVNATKILTHWNFSSPASFHKTSTDTLTLYVNHTMNGV